MNNVSFLPSDAKSAEERLVGQNASLRSIQANEIGNVRELQLETARQQDQLGRLLVLYNKINNTINNLTRAVEMLTDLEQNLMMGTKQGSKVVSIINNWTTAHGDSFDF